MAEVKWIKIVTDIFDDEKIKIIDKYPARDEILVIWFKLLALAGKVNEDGLLFMSNRIPYTSDMLSAIFNREEKSIELALGIFTRFGMITIEDNEIISITNWDKHQNIDGLDKIREQNRKRVAAHREKKKKLLTGNVTCNVTVTESNAIELEIDKEEEKIPYTAIVDYLNKKIGSKYLPTTRTTQEHVNARFREGYKLQDFLTVIEKKVKEWQGTERAVFLRPQTLFGTKFESYLNQPDIEGGKGGKKQGPVGVIQSDLKEMGKRKEPICL